MAKPKFEKFEPEILQLMLKKVPPADIQKKFKMGIASVHNMKKKFKEQGHNIPDVRGKRSIGELPKVKVSVDDVLSRPVQRPQSMPKKEEPSIASTTGLTMTINGISVQIGEGAKNLSISGNRIIIDF